MKIFRRVKQVLAIAAIFLPLWLIWRQHAADLPLPRDARTGLVRVLGIPLIAFSYLCWSILPALYRREYRKDITSTISRWVLLGLGLFALIGLLQGNGMRGVTLELQLWLGLWAGVGLAYTVAMTRLPFLAHLAITIWCLVCVSEASALIGEGRAIGEQRVTDPIIFHYLEMLLPLSGLFLLWRETYKGLGMLAGVVVSGVLIALSAIVTIGRSATLAFLVVLLVMLVTDLCLSRLKREKVRRKYFILGGRILAAAMIIGGAVLVAQHRGTLKLLERFQDDTYSLSENVRLVEMTTEFARMDGVDHVIGRGIGAGVGENGESLGLHIGLATLPVKFGWPVGIALWTALLLLVRRILRRMLGPTDGQKHVSTTTIAAFPAIAGLLAISSMSGGYYDFTNVVIGYMVAWIVIKRRAKAREKKKREEEKDGRSAMAKV